MGDGVEPGCGLPFGTAITGEMELGEFPLGEMLGDMAGESAGAE